MYRSSETALRPSKKRTFARAATAALFSAILGASGAAFAAPHGGFHGGGFHGGGFQGRGFHAGGVHGGFRHGFDSGLGLGLGSPWEWGYYPPAYGYYSYAAGQNDWYYCPNPAGYYPYVAQCYGPWQVVPAS